MKNRNTTPRDEDHGSDLTTEDLGERIRQSLQRLEESAHKLALQGWVIPMELTPRETHEILARGTSESVDQWFIAYYSNDNDAHFESIATMLQGDDSLRRWRDLLASNFFCLSPATLRDRRSCAAYRARRIDCRKCW